MNQEPVRNNARIIAAIVGAIVGSVAALETATVALMIELGMREGLAQAIGTFGGVIITIAGATVAILKGAEVTRHQVTPWTEEGGAMTPAPTDTPHGDPTLGG